MRTRKQYEATGFDGLGVGLNLHKVSGMFRPLQSQRSGFLNVLMEVLRSL